MAQSALVADNIEAGRKFLAEFTHQITEENTRSAYIEVHQIARRLKDPWFESFDVRVIDDNDPLAVAAKQMQSFYGPDVPRRLSDSVFGGRSVEEVYIYPTPVPAS